MRFIDLFARLGGFHIALNSLGHKCVFASEINDVKSGEIDQANWFKLTIQKIKRPFDDF
jgi:DNA (cytosine-5)-methyltransferase 1